MPARLYGGTKFVFNVKNRALFHNVENESTINLFDQLATISYFHLQSALYFYFADKLQDKPPSGLLTRFGSAELRGVLSKHFSQNPLFHRKWDG